MDNKIFALRLRTARLFCGYSLDHLAGAAHLSVTRQSLYRYEHGDMLPRREVLTALATAFGVSEKYFTGESLTIDLPMLRSSADSPLTEAEEEQLSAQLAFWAERYIRMETRAFGDAAFRNPLSDANVGSDDEAITASEQLREAWHCGDGPIASVLRLMERKGIKVLSHPLPDKVYGLSTWANGRYPLIVLDMRTEKTTIERLRFTAAHELGHLLLHFAEGVDTAEQEKLCHKFAGFFIFPRTAFMEEMGAARRETLTLGELIDLKQVYGMSVAAQVHEAYDLGIINHRHYDWWYNERINRNPREEGWGSYPYPESLGREERIESIADNEPNL